MNLYDYYMIKFLNHAKFKKNVDTRLLNLA